MSKSKRMKSPEKNPPAEAADMAGANIAAPNIDIAQQAMSGMELETTAPKQVPPSRAEAEAITAIGAAVWQTDKRVTGLYTTYHSRNAWMYIAGIGWKRLANTSDSAQEAMNLLASHCREKNCRIDFSEDGGIVREIYVW